MNDNASIQHRAERAVRRGIRYLDGHKPRWLRRIKLDTLSLRSPQHCVLAQVYGDFGEGLAAIAQSNQTGGALGFSLTGEEYMTWEALETEWRRQITARRNAQ